MSTPMPAPFRPGGGPSTVEAGDRLDGRYLLLETVGRGGSGSVWRAHDELLGRDVAVKRLHVGRLDDPERARVVRDRARREGRVAARLHHPRLASIFDMTTLDGEVCLVMEFVRAPSLADLLDRHGRLAPPRVARIGGQIAEGLAAMHRRGIVHRDIKPANVMIGPDDQVTVTDFGIAVVDAEPETADRLVAGTPHFMAPEVARGGTATAAADVFSLGATLYTALEGAPPVGHGGNALEVLARVAAGVVPPARRSGELGGLLATLLERDPEHRPSARRIADTLGPEVTVPPEPPVRTAEPVTGPIAPAVAPGTGPSRRRLALALGVVGAAGALGVLAASSLSWTPEPTPSPTAALPPVPVPLAGIPATTSAEAAPTSATASPVADETSTAATSTAAASPTATTSAAPRTAAVTRPATERPSSRASSNGRHRPADQSDRGRQGSHPGRSRGRNR